MRTVVRFVACVASALSIAACGPLDGIYIREGIGTNLGTPDLPQVTDLQDVYIGEICRQAGLRVSQQGSVLYCDEVAMRPGEWATFVQAGMNDIDRRCDAYLAWLDNKKRWREPILKQLGTTAAATAAILGLTGAGAEPIAIVATAFGFAQDTFINFHSRLITEVNHSVIQSVVLDNQNQFRVKAGDVRVDNRPAAIYLLRNYLRICMPFSIEMSINNTMTVYHRAGPEVLAQTTPMLTRAPSVARVSAVRTTATLAPRAPLAPRDVIREPTRAPYDAHPEYALILDPYVRTKHSEQYVISLLKALCVPDIEIDLLSNQDKVGPITMAQIAIFEDAYGPTRRSEKRKNGKLDDDEATQVRGTGSCLPGGARNYFEKVTYRSAVGTKALGDLVKSLNKALPDNPLPADASLEGARAKIRAVRADPAISPKLQLTLPAALADQVTRDLLLALPKP